MHKTFQITFNVSTTAQNNKNNNNHNKNNNQERKGHFNHLNIIQNCASRGDSSILFF